MSFQNAKNSLSRTVRNVFGTNAVYTYLSDSSTSDIKGVFENAFVEVNGVVTKAPALRIILEDLTSEPVEGDRVEINSVVYIVRYHEPDSHGSTKLILEKL